MVGTGRSQPTCSSACAWPSTRSSATERAMYVYPPEIIRLKLPPPRVPGQLLDRDLHPAGARRGDRAGAQAPAPGARLRRQRGGGALCVHTPNTTVHLWPRGRRAPYPAHDKYFQISSTRPDNCFALYRQEGTCVYDDDLGTYTFGSGVDLDGVGPNPPVFVIDRPSAENSVTSRVNTESR